MSMVTAGGGGMEIIGEVGVRVRALDDKFRSDLDERLPPAVEEARKKAQASVDKLADGMKDFGKKASTYVTLPLVGALGFATNAASDLNEAVNVTGLVFGDARREIDEMAKTAAVKLGQSERAFRENSASVGGLLVNLGYTREEAARLSVDLVGLASDMGSAFNKDPAEAAAAITAALRGETEQIRQFNVVVDEAAIKQEAQRLGLVHGTEELDKHAKAQAVLSLIQKQTAAVQGDFANTSNEAANSQRILKAQVEDSAAKLGTNLLPVYKDVLGFARGAVEAFTDMDPAMQKVVLGLAGVAVAAGPVSGAIGNIISLGRDMQKFFANVGVAGPAAFVALAAVAAIYTKALVDNNRHADELLSTLEKDRDTSSIENLRKELDEMGAEFNTHLHQLQESNDKYGTLGASIGEFVQNLTPMDNKLGENRATVDKLHASYEELRVGIERADAHTTEFARDNDLTRTEVEKLAKANGIDLTGSYKQVVPALQEALDKLREGDSATQQMSASAEVLSSKVEDNEAKLKAWRTALDLALGGQLSNVEASINFQQSIDDLSQKLVENGASMDITTEKGRAVQGALIDVVQAAQDEVQALVDSGQASADASEMKRLLLQRLEDVKKKFPELKGPIDDYIAKIGEIPETKGTAAYFDSQRATFDIDAYKRALKTIPEEAFSRANFDPQAIITATGRDTGGRVYQGHGYVVGEKHAEWFEPDANGMIYPGVPQVAMPNISFTFQIAGNADDAAVERFRLVAREEIAPVIERVMAGVAAGTGTRSG